MASRHTCTGRTANRNAKKLVGSDHKLCQGALGRTSGTVKAAYSRTLLTFNVLLVSPVFRPNRKVENKMGPESRLRSRRILLLEPPAWLETAAQLRQPPTKFFQILKPTSLGFLRILHTQNSDNYARLPGGASRRHSVGKRPASSGGSLDRQRPADGSDRGSELCHDTTPK